MIRNYLKTAIRSLLRNRVFSLIKISGLSIGLTVCVLIFLYTKDEVSYDQFHENKSQLYRIIQNFQVGNDQPQTIGITNAVVGASFANEIPEVKQCIRITGTNVTVKRNNSVFVEKSLFTDERFLSVFTFPLKEGNKKTALQDPHSIVLSADMAKKYFGTSDAVGETMQIKLADEFENFTVTAIAENAPQNSTLKIDMLMPLSYYERHNSNQDWFGGSLNTFLLLSPQANTSIVEKKMQALFDENTKEQLAKIKQEKGMSIKVRLALQPLTAIHLSTNAGPDNGMTDGSKPVYSYILTSIAFFILLIACFNFINLAIAQSLKRSKEIGIRKVLGSTRKQLVKQFLTESMLVSLLAFLIAGFLTRLALPFFNELANKKLSFSYLSDGWLYAGLFLLLLLTSFLSGIYPSLVLSAFRPVTVLYNKQKIMGRSYFTKTLIVLQFGLAIFLMTGSIAINRQLSFLSRADLGYDSKGLVMVTLPVNKSSDPLPALIRSELSTQSNVLAVTARNSGRSISEVRVDGKMITIEKTRIDDKFLSTFKIPLVAGRDFSAEYPSDIMHAVIVNESFVREAGWQNGTAIGKTVNYLSGNNKSATIVGVVRDYHFLSLKEKITPALLTMDSNFNYGQVWIKIKPSHIPETMAGLQTAFKKIVPYFPYTSQFMDDLNAKNYQAETKWKQIINIASALFIFISCIGLLGLVILSIEQRTKEIGIRKVMGAGVAGIAALISKEFILLISIAFVIAVPAAYYAIDKWLQGFAYRINIGWWMFPLAGGLVIIIALLTTSFQAIRAALMNPVKSLRTE